MHLVSWKVLPYTEKNDDNSLSLLHDNLLSPKKAHLGLSLMCDKFFHYLIKISRIGYKSIKYCEKCITNP